MSLSNEWRIFILSLLSPAASDLKQYFVAEWKKYFNKCLIQIMRKISNEQLMPLCDKYHQTV